VFIVLPFHSKLGCKETPILLPAESPPRLLRFADLQPVLANG